NVRVTISLLCELSRSRTPIRGWRQKNVEDFRALIKQIKGLQKVLGKMPSAALVLLFSGEDDVGSEKIPSTEVQQRVERRLRQMVATLAYMRARCNFLL